MKHTPHDNPCLHSSAKTQQGAVLIFGLILLLALTLIGISSMQGSVFNEKMAGNSRDRNFAFQAAESALRDGELWLTNNPVQPLANPRVVMVCGAQIVPARETGGKVVAHPGLMERPASSL